ncbi:hypothetical protein [Paraglaciecola hydrolytica]|uniref:Uncharacterized protein n=1 Tax=Paraglaciecola hydrolytica TaxID=1799789 RepID=A0A148KKH5_9ALTE|nr:hypothetical protein [Paraglaciecola hydrolytica]KXI26780.1 hypothetical protein AX660_03150 [Paraglaciecola hydrolytica]
MLATTSYELLKTAYWYQFIKQPANKLELEQTNEEITFLENKISNAKRKSDLDAFKAKLNKAFNKSRRLKRSGASLDELSTYFFDLEKEIDFDKYIQEVDDTEASDVEGRPVTKFEGYFQKKAWGNYSSARSCPAKSLVGEMSLLTELLVLEPMNEAAFQSGPALIFNVFETVNIRDAVRAFFNSVSFVIAESVLSNILDQTSAVSLYKELMEFEHYPVGYSELTKLDGYKATFSNVIAEVDYLPAGYRVCIELAYAFIKAKYIGETRKLAKVCFEQRALEILEIEFGIPKDAWLKMKGKDTFKVLDEFIEAKICFDQDPTIEPLDWHFLEISSLTSRYSTEQIDELFEANPFQQA